MSQRKLNRLLEEIRGCQVCAGCLPHNPNPVLSAHADARLLLIGQAPDGGFMNRAFRGTTPQGIRFAIGYK